MANDENEIQCEILLESGETIQYADGVKYLHYPGQSVFGKVVLTVYLPTYFQALDVGIRAEANTEFDRYFGIEEYFMDLLNLAYNIELQPGEYSYPFSFKLPMKLPYSFESKYGSVTFEIAVVTDLETTNPDVIGELLLRIVSNINLNSYPKLKTVTYKKSRLSRIMKIDKEEIATLKTRGISERENVKFEESLIIPPKTLPTELACGIIDITYWLKVKVNVKGCYNTPSPEYLTKIVIGDICINDMDEKLGAGKSYWEPQENEALSSRPSLISRHSIKKSLAEIKQSSFSKSLLNQRNLPSREPTPKKPQKRQREESHLGHPPFKQPTQISTEAFLNQPNSHVRSSFSQQELGRTQRRSNQQNQRNQASISLSAPPLPLPAPPLPLPLPPPPLSLLESKNETNFDNESMDDINPPAGSLQTSRQNIKKNQPVHFVVKLLNDLTHFLRS